MPRYIAITDIHGEKSKLDSVLAQIEPTDNDVYVFMGDYIDRGPDSKGVIDRVIEWGENHRCVYLIGSHEYALLHASSDEYYKFLFDNYGGPATVRSYGSFDNIFKTHGDFFRNLKFYYLTEKYLFVHAGINPNYPLEEQDEVDLVYIRGKFIYSKHKLPQKIIFGHTEFDEPYIDDDKICIDTGCGKYKDAHLTAIILNEDGSEEFICS